MNLYVHLLLYDILRSIFNIYSFFIILGVIVHQCSCLTRSLRIYSLIIGLAAGAIYRLRLSKPEFWRVRRVLGVEWGAYKYFKTGPACEDEEEITVKVVGHRACGLDAPENSMSALNRMFQKGIQMVEFDVLLTHDNIPIVFHDPNLCRMANLNKLVACMTLEEIKQVDISVKHPFGEHFLNEQIPTLYEFVYNCISNNIRMIIDLKVGTSKMVDIISNLFKDFPELYDLAMVSSFDPVLIYKIRSKDPKIVSSLCWRPYFHSHEGYCGIKGPISPRSTNPIKHVYHRLLNVLHTWFLWNLGYYVIGISVILLAKEAITRDEIRYWGKRGIRVIAWSVNLPSEKQYFENILEITYMTDTVINS